MSSLVKFMHYRDLDDRGNVLPQGGTTVAYETTSKGTRYATAKCSPYDNYCKAYGRAKSAGRLKAVGAETHFCDEVEYTGKDFQRYMDSLIMGEDFDEDGIPF